MKQPIYIEKTITVGLNVRDLAHGFAMLSDDQQAEFLVEVVKFMNGWESHAREMQLHQIGVELRGRSAGEREQVLEMFDNIVHSATRSVRS